MNEAETRADHIALALTADYILEYKNTKLAVLEAKVSDEPLAQGAAQTKNFGGKLQPRTAYASNDWGHYAIDITIGPKAELPLDTFAWPQSSTKKQIEAIAATGREIRKVRADALQKMTGDLRALYRTLELPGQNPLKDAHAALDTAVLAAYNFNSTADLLAQRLQLNIQVAADIDAGNPVTPPGVPSVYSETNTLISRDCIQP